MSPRKYEELVLEFLAASDPVFPVFLSYLISVILVLDAILYFLNSLKIEEWPLFLALLHTLLTS